MKMGNYAKKKYFKASDLEERELELTTKEVVVEEVGMERDEKPILIFSDHECRLIVNATNCDTLIKAWGDDGDGWKGKRLKLVVEPVKFGDGVVKSIKAYPVSDDNLSNVTAEPGEIT